MVESSSVQKDIELATRVLKDAGAQEVYIFGSASRGMEHSASDIDLAVRGLPPERFYEAVGTVLSSISRSCDVIDLDEHNPFSEYLERKGELKRVA